MMKMEKILIITLALAAGTGSLTACAIEPATVSAEELARAFLARPPAERWDGDFHFTRLQSDGRQESVRGEFVLNSPLEVVELTINNQLVVGPTDPPLAGLPVNDRGIVINYSLYLVGYDETGEQVARGFFNQERLAPGDPIVITLEPFPSRHLVGFEPPAGMENEAFGLRLADQTGWFDYRPDIGGFEVWIQPGQDLNYRIFDLASDLVWQSGQIGQPADSDQSVIGIRYPGGIQAIDLESNRSIWITHRQFDAQVWRDGQLVPAAVYMIRPNGLEFYFTVSGGLTSPGQMEVRQWSSIGQMPLVAEVQQDQFILPIHGGYLDSMTVNIPAGFDRLIVTVLGQTDATGFNIGVLPAGVGFGK